MDTRVTSTSSVEAVLECAVCLDVFTNPRVLPCQHTTCCDCLQDIIDAAKSAGKFQCPSCRAEYKTPKGGAASFPKNLIASSLIDAMDSKQRGSRPNSGSGGGTSVPVAAPANQCPRHPRQELDYYCSTCEAVSCSQCCIEGHKNHNYTKINDASAMVRTKFTVALISAGKHMEQLRQAKKELEDKRTEIETDVQQARKEISGVAEMICRSAREQESQMLEKVNQVEMQALNKVALALKNCEQNLRSAKMLCLNMKDVQAKASTVVIGMRTPTMRHQLAELKKAPLETITWESRIAKKEEGTLPMERLLGKLEIRDNIPTAVPRPMRRSTRGSSSSSSQTLGPSIHQMKLNSKNDVTGMAIVHNCLYVTHFRDPYIWIYDLLGRMLLKLGIPRLFNPCGLAVLNASEGRIAITDTASVKLVPKPPCKLHMLKVTEEHIIEDHQIRRLEYVPGQISVDKAGHMLVTVLGQNSFRIHRSDVNTSESVQLPAASPLHVLRCSSTGFLLAEHSKVMWLSKEGKVVQVVRAYEGRSSHDPLGSAVQLLQDSNDRVVVVDRNRHQLHLLSPEGTFLRYLLEGSEQVRRPSRACLNEQLECLYVAHGETEKVVSVYPYKCATGTSQSDDLAMTSSHFMLRLMLNGPKG